MKNVGVKGKNNPAYTHGHTVGKFSPTYQSWATMLQRCNNPNVTYFKYYGGKGIKVCNRWYKFENFLADMGERPKGKTLDRLDSDKDYSPENCRWATKSEQSRHRAKVREAHLAKICKLCITPTPTYVLVERLNLHAETVRGMIRELRGKQKVETIRCVPQGKSRVMLVTTISNGGHM